jgi:hypothetical protein
LRYLAYFVSGHGDWCGGSQNKLGNWFFELTYHIDSRCAPLEKIKIGSGNTNRNNK